MSRNGDDGSPQIQEGRNSQGAEAMGKSLTNERSSNSPLTMHLPTDRTGRLVCLPRCTSEIFVRRSTLPAECAGGSSNAEEYVVITLLACLQFRIPSSPGVLARRSRQPTTKPTVLATFPTYIFCRSKYEYDDETLLQTKAEHRIENSLAGKSLDIPIGNCAYQLGSQDSNTKISNGRFLFYF
ncbi:hypothetical protein ACRALDRAFT_212922 [Sodiomyces alcalophilus JCM 7366]|uniref:uncharacterized protein n=1 Tax=Sodiomyces alcalophilus JCM 7366 TaxID=591952 RepID=UPI0039B398DD